MNPPFVPADTDPDVFRRQIDRWRSMTPAQRLKVADQLSRDVTSLAVAGIRFERPEATPAEVRCELIRRRYGQALADVACDSTPTA